MNVLQKMGTELAYHEKEAVTLKLEIKKRILAGESTGNVAMDFALASGRPRDERSIAEIEAFHGSLKAHAGETAVVVFAKRVRAVDNKELEARLCQLPATPTFRFNEAGLVGWILGERYATMTSSARVETVREERLYFGSTVFPNDNHRLELVTHHFGNAAVADYFRSGGAFGPLDHGALSEKLGLPGPTLKIPKTPTLQEVG